MESVEHGYLLGGRWGLLEPIGEGGMGQVYRARDAKTGDFVAVKILERDAADKDGADRFYLEAQVSRRLRHPHIVDLYDFGFDEYNGFYMVMELLEGCDLAKYLTNHPEDIPLDVIGYLFEQICDAMSHAHNKGVVHRDLKPSNIFLVGGPEALDHVKLLDFGIAKVENNLANHNTAQGIVLGTPRYVSPEQAQGLPMDHRSDLYSLAAILFEVLTRRPLFTANKPFEYLFQHVKAPIPSLLEVAPDKGFPPALDHLLTDALAKKPEDRPSSLTVFRNLLYEAIFFEPHPSLDPTDEMYDPVVSPLRKPKIRSADGKKPSKPVIITARKGEGDRPKSRASQAVEPDVSESGATPRDILSAAGSRKGTSPRGTRRPPSSGNLRTAEGPSVAMPDTRARLQSAQKVATTPPASDEPKKPSKLRFGAIVLGVTLLVFSLGLFGWTRFVPEHPLSKRVVKVWTQASNTVRRWMGKPVDEEGSPKKRDSFWDSLENPPPRR